MTQNEYFEFLLKTLEDLQKACHWLNRSSQKCIQIGVKENYSDDEFDAFENLTSRFARTSDLLIQKVYRSIDKVEFEEGGTLIDVLNRAHKRGLLDSLEEVRQLRELRNEITHEYKAIFLPPIFKSVLQQTPLLLTLVEKVILYSKKY